MKKLTSILILVLLFAGTLLNGCSKEESKVEKTKKSITKFTEKTADKAVKKIKNPLNKAKDAADRGADRLEEIGDALKK